MANVYRSEVVLKGTDSSIESFINDYFSLEQECKYFDLEKVLPLEGREPEDVWQSCSEAYNFEVIQADNGVFKFRFDTNENPPLTIFYELLRRFKHGSSRISFVSCCEHLTTIVKLEGNDNLVITCLQWNDSGKLSRKIIKKIALKLWGYSNKPNLEEQGFVHVGGGQYIKMHFDMNCVEDLYPRFKNKQ